MWTEKVSFAFCKAGVDNVYITAGRIEHGIHIFLEDAEKYSWTVNETEFLLLKEYSWYLP
jgi:hypothetical protein